MAIATRAARRSDERADARGRRAGARLRRRHDPRHRRSGSAVPLGQRRATCGSCIAGWRRRVSGWPRPARSPTSPAARARRSCRLAVTQSRGLGRLLEDHLRARPDLIAAADGARIKISGCPNGCGQHHIATIGFQGSVRRLGSRAVPQYFVMVGGGAHDRGATFGRLAAKIPARRIPEVVERLIDLYAARAASRARRRPAFFGRVELDAVKRAARRPRDAAAGRRGAGRLHRSRRGGRVRAGGDGRGVLGVIDVCGCIDLHCRRRLCYSRRVDN